MQRRCYICHTLVPHYEYTGHVGQCVSANVMGKELEPGPSYYPPSNHGENHRGAMVPAYYIPTRLRAQPTEETTPPRASHCETQLDAFQVWYNGAHNSAKYTIIDGGKCDSDLLEFTVAAKTLRDATEEEVAEVVKGFQGFLHNDHRETCLELVRKAPIFPGLIAYIYTHLVTCSPRRWFGREDSWLDRVSELKTLVESWSRYEDTLVILKCTAIKKELLNILRVTKIATEEHKCNSALLNGKMVLNNDVLNLAALVALGITGRRKTDILEERGAQVGELLELFHDLLESNVGLDERYRRHFFSVLIFLSKESMCFPRGLYLTGGAICHLELKGGGGFGSVFKGELGSRLVAVKALERDRSISLPKYRKEFSKEAVVWRYLRHPNCLPLYGTYDMHTEGRDMRFAFVSPWMNQGTLSEYLKRNPEASRTKLILDVVRGLSYLHTMEPHIAHRDIKPVNILITNKGRACLADFGLASTFDVNDYLHTAASQVQIAGTWDYMAPEIFSVMDDEERSKSNLNKRACDMYALGCTMYEAYTGHRPYNNIPHALVPAHVVKGGRPKFPAGKITHDMWSFAEKLWDPKPEQRLTAKMALAWMETKASHEGIDNSCPTEEEWEWKNENDEKKLWSVPF